MGVDEMIAELGADGHGDLSDGGVVGAGLERVNQFQNGEIADFALVSDVLVVGLRVHIVAGGFVFGVEDGCFIEIEAVDDFISYLQGLVVGGQRVFR